MSLYPTLSDYELFTLLQEDDKLAYAEIYNRYFKVLFLHAYKKLEDKEEAKDLIQDLFTMFWIKRKDITIQSNLLGFLYKATKNRVLDRFANEKVKSKYINSLQTYINQHGPETDHPIRHKELEDIINKEIAALPAKMRLVFEMSRLQHMSHKEIAAELNISEQTVSKQISNALRILKDKLGALGILYFLLNL